MADESSVRDFAASFQSFIQTMSASAPSQQSPLVSMLREHFAVDPSTLPVVSDSFDVPDHANLQLAIDDYVGSQGRQSALHGIHTRDVYRGVSLSDIVAGAPYDIAPVEYVNLSAGDDRTVAAVRRGLYIVREEGNPLVILVRGTNEFQFHSKFMIEVMAREKSAAEVVLHTLRKTMRARNIYRGQIISLSIDQMHSLEVHFSSLSAHRSPGHRVS